MESDEVGSPAPAAAAAELAALRAGRERIAERAMQPWWYDALLGLLVFGLVASYSAHSTWVVAGALVVFLLGVRGLVGLYTHLTGMWVRGDRKGRTRRAWWVWVAGYVVVMAAGLAAEYLLGWPGAMVVTGAVLGVGAGLISRWWTRIYVAELREEP